MSVDVHDQYCGSFGVYSDCKECRDGQRLAMMTPRERAKQRLPSNNVNTSIVIMPKPANSDNQR